MKEDNVYWVVSKRSKLFTWTPVRVYANRNDADEYRDYLESESKYSSNGAKVDRVLMGTSDDISFMLF